MGSLDRLWGTYLASMAIDILKHKVELRIFFTKEGRRVDCTLLLEEVQEFRFFDERPFEWDLAELTEVRGERLGDLIHIDMVMWVEEAGLTIRCGKATLDGEPLDL
ncbi:hypothetical protein [Thermoactinospora rubra]|uniref:hypothetical protein n=1 Tax=Thermoactinospora rubra TaxID=1088767 RepID=UPI00117C2FC7|nr:hypothetical protein [Thermoactinospora rubra]